MKKLNRPEVWLTMLFLAVSFLLFFHNKIVLFLCRYISKDEIKTIFLYATPFLIITSSVFIYFFTKNIREKIFRTHKQYYHLFDRNPTPMGIIDIDTNQFLAVNKAALNCYGYSRDELFSMTANDIRVKETEETAQNYTGVSYGLKPGGVRKHRKKNGDIILTEVSSQEVIFKNKKCLLLLSRDITEIVKAKEEKRIAEEEKISQQNFTSYILENFPVDVAIFDKDHKYILLNKTAVKNDEIRKWMIGKDDFDYFRRKGGTDMMIAEKRREKFLKAVAGESNEWVDEHVIDGELKYKLRKFFPYFENGQLKYVYGYGMDITEIKKAQIQRDEHTRQLEKIAFITSHKLRQPICNLQGLLSLLELEYCDNPKFNELVGCMKNSITNMDEFTRDLATKLHEYKQNLLSTTKAD